MPKLKIRHLVEKPGADGPRFYWQPAAPLRDAGWKPRRLTGPQGAPLRTLAEAIAMAELLNEEVDAWRRGELPANAPPAAVARGKRAPAGSVEALVADYKRSRWWTKLAPKTQHDYSWALDAIILWAGDMPVRSVTPPAVQAFYTAQLQRVEGTGRKRKVIKTPAKAAAAVRVLRLLLQVGVRLGYVATNAAIKPGISYERQREPVVWTPEQVRHMAAAADAEGWHSVATAILLNEWIGQREADVLALTPWKVEADALRIRQEKTKRVVVLPVHLVPHLVERLRAERERAGAVVSTEHLLLHEGTGKEWNPHTFRHVFAEIRERAANPTPEQIEAGAVAMPSCADLRFMELRHTAVTRLDEAGVDALGIAGITGHSSKTVVDMLEKHYLTRTSKAAEGAFRKRLAAESEGS